MQLISIDAFNFIAWDLRRVPPKREYLSQRNQDLALKLLKCVLFAENLPFSREHILKLRQIETAVLCTGIIYLSELELIVLSCTWDTEIVKYNLK